MWFFFIGCHHRDNHPSPHFSPLPSAVLQLLLLQIFKATLFHPAYPHDQIWLTDFGANWVNSKSVMTHQRSNSSHQDLTFHFRFLFSKYFSLLIAVIINLFSWLRLSFFIDSLNSTRKTVRFRKKFLVKRADERN